MIEKSKEISEVQNDRLVKKITLAEYPQLEQAHKLVTNFSSFTCVIAGGAPRDVLTGREVKDVDVFIHADSPQSFSRAIMQIGHTCGELGLDCKVEVTGGYGSARITAGNIDICIKDSLLSPDALVKSFDMVSSQAWFEVEADGFRVYSTDLFNTFDEKKVLGYYPENINYDRLDRICEKFPDYLPIALSVRPAEDRKAQRPASAPPAMVDDGFDDHIPF